MAAAPPDRPKFRRRAEARPDEVLDAALELFIEKGFAATRVEDIARRAGLSKGTVYLYFPSKEAVIEGLVRRALLPIADSALGFVRDFEGDPRTVIAMVMKMLAGRLHDPKVIAIPKIVFREVVAVPELATMSRREVLDRVIPAVEALIRRGIADGYLRPVDPHLTIRSIVGPIILHVIMADVFDITPPEGLSFDRMIDNHLSILFHGISAPDAPAPASASAAEASR
ncbi:MAG TPA: TetR/AcrR family transcriptional regulator [Alphaproteobacteria bacterium]|nr:TetR/AcrR family transcriptional regulator [Alphaproteobacteria bacterium]